MGSNLPIADCPFPYVTWYGGTSSDWSAPSNWVDGELPLETDTVDILFHPSAQNDLVLNSNKKIGYIDFNGSGKKVILGNYKLNAIGFLRANESSYVQTNGTGMVVIGVGSYNESVFPVGTDSYTPVRIRIRADNFDIFSVRVTNEVYYNGTSSGNVVDKPRVMRTWHIDKAKPNGDQGVDLSFKWNPQDESHPLTKPTLNHHNGTTWSIVTSGIGNPSTDSLMHLSYMGTFSPFAIGEDAIPLSVPFISYSPTVSFSLYPNPTEDFITVRTDNTERFYAISDIYGKIIQEGELTEAETELDLSSLTSGIYFVKIGGQVQKFMKK